MDWGIAPELSGRLAEREWWERRAVKPDFPHEQLLIMAIPNTFIAVEHILLMATGLGLGTCWLNAVDDSRFNQLFGLPENIVSAALVTVGYPAGQIPPQRPRISMEQMLLKPSHGHAGSSDEALK